MDVLQSALFEAGGYRYVRGPFQYSGGVAAEPGFAIERARFSQAVPLAEGFRRIERHLTALGRPFTSFCACELRSPAQFTDQGFIDFNRIYVGTLERWGIFKNDENPAARSNVCPEIDGPPEPCFEAFSYTVPAPLGTGAAAGPSSFVIAGSGEARDQPGLYRDKIVRFGETSSDAMREKARHVLGVMEARMAALGLGWADATATQVYTVHDLHPFLAEEIVGRGAARAGLTWYYARPPVEGLEYEMDLRGVPVERVL
jgi:hypothetical protein